MLFRVILRWQPFSRTLISRPSLVSSFSNFHPRPLSIFIIWPKYATHTISRDSKTATFFAYPIAQANILSFRECGSAPRIIFARNCCQYSLFGLNMLLVRFRAFSRPQPFSHAQSCMLISRPSEGHSFYSFRAHPLPIFVIWSKYATQAIPRDFEMATLFACPVANANIPAHPRALLL